MGILDLNPRNQEEAQATAQPALHLPATFGESFEAAWDQGRLFGQSIAQGNAQAAAFDDYLTRVKQFSGEDITGKSYGNVDMFTAAQKEVRRLKDAGKLEQNFPDLDEDYLNRQAVQRSREAQRAGEEMGDRPQTIGGRVGGFLGGAAAAATDPINLVATVFAPEAELGILATGLRWGALAGAGQSAVEAIGAPYHEEVQPGYFESGEPAKNILEAAAFGGVTGSAAKVLGNAWTRVKTGSWPRSVRDAGNVIESEAQVQNSNVFRGTEGEIAHRKALLTALDQVLSGEPINVAHIITPEIEAASRRIITRLEGEAGMALPIFDERAVRLISEEAGLRERDSLLQSQREAVGAGDPAAVEKLARLEEIERQAQSAIGPERRAVRQRRDELLQDTTPEKLREEARPVQLARDIDAERGNIAARRAEIAQEQARIDAEAKLSPAGRQMLGQRMPARLVPFERVRQAAAEAKGVGPTADALANSIRQVALDGGIALDEEDVRTLVKSFTKLAPEQADAAAKYLRTQPRAMAAEARGVSKVEDDAIAPVPPERVEAMKKLMDTPEQQAAMRMQLETSAKPGETFVNEVNEKGEPVKVSLGKILREIDDDRIAADQIEACVTPAPEPAEK